MDLVALYFMLMMYATPIQGYDLTILHTNDIHSRIEETNKYGGTCSDPNGQCYGGMARLKSKIDELKFKNPNTLVLDAGDQFQGTIWFNHFGGVISSVFMNKLGYDAMTLGNHEFDKKVAGLLPFLRNVTFPVLSCNIDASEEPEVQSLLRSHVVINVGGEKIGIIGYTTKDTPILSFTEKLVFHDEISSLKSVVQTLEKEGVNKIIALGHAGYHVDKKIAAEVSGIDVIVGGHTNTFLYTGTKPSNDEPEGPYPTVVTQRTGNKVLVVQDYAYGKYLGELHVTFDDEGKITNYSGNPVLLDHTVAKDISTESLIQHFSVELANINNKVLGRTLVRLNENSCRVKECNLGNLLADCFVRHTLRHADTKEDNTVFIGWVNSGAIPTSLQPGNITLGGVLNVQVFRNTIEQIRLKGKYILAALENSVSKLPLRSGRFLQFSGMRVTYDVSRPVGQRVADVWVRCANCSELEYRPLDNGTEYSIVLSNYLIDGGDGYDVIKEHATQDVISGDLDSDVFATYIQEMSPLYPGVEGRIKFVNISLSVDNKDVLISVRQYIPLNFILIFITLVTLVIGIKSTLFNK